MQMIYLYIDSHKEALRPHVINIHRELNALHIHYRVVLQISSRVLREAPAKKKSCKFGHRPKGGGVETLAQIVCGSSSVNINNY